MCVDYSVDGQEEEHRSDTAVPVHDDDGQSHCDGNNVKVLKGITLHWKYDPSQWKDTGKIPSHWYLNEEMRFFVSLIKGKRQLREMQWRSVLEHGLVNS